MTPWWFLLAPVLASLCAVGVAPAGGETITVARGECARLARHAPCADVAYRPGTDVRGRPVAPAELDSAAPIALPEEFVIPITFDLRDRLGLPAGTRLFEPRTNIGAVVYRDGRAWLNGRALPSACTAAPAARCRARLREDG